MITMTSVIDVFPLSSEFVFSGKIMAQTFGEVGAEADAFAWSMLAMIGLAFGVVAMLGLSMWHHVRRRDAAVDDLLEELQCEEREQQQQKTTSSVAAPALAAWERDADWWRRES